ncbi:MAG: response regulator [Gammaproteobacteria bacterium]
MDSEARTLETDTPAPLGKTARRPAARRVAHRPQLLLADDSEAVRVLTASLLKRLGCDVDAVEDGEAALGMARQTRYHLILLDLDMPLMDGITAAREIRRLSTNSGTPIMAVSAFLEGIGDPRERSRLFDGELAKPVSSDQLRQLLVEAWPQPSGTGQDAPDEDHHFPLADRGILNTAVLRAGGRTAVDAIDTAIEEMRSCAAGLDLAIARDDIVPLKRTASKLNRIALSCGAARLARRAAALSLLPKETPTGELRSSTTRVLGCIAATIAELKEIVHEA